MEASSLAHVAGVSQPSAERACPSAAASPLASACSRLALGASSVVARTDSVIAALRAGSRPSMRTSVHGGVRLVGLLGQAVRLVRTPPTGHILPLRNPPTDGERSPPGRT